MATHSSILAWEMSRTEEPGGLEAMGSQRVGRLSYKNTVRSVIKVGVEMEVGPRSKERQNRHQRHRGEGQEKTRQTGGMLPQAKKPLGTRAGRDKAGSPLGPSEGPWPC